jgi:hypothetical protein
VNPLSPYPTTLGVVSGMAAAAAPLEFRTSHVGMRLEVPSPRRDELGPSQRHAVAWLYAGNTAFFPVGVRRALSSSSL